MKTKYQKNRTKRNGERTKEKRFKQRRKEVREQRRRGKGDKEEGDGSRRDRRIWKEKHNRIMRTLKKKIHFYRLLCELRRRAGGEESVTHSAISKRLRWAPAVPLLPSAGGGWQGTHAASGCPSF